MVITAAMLAAAGLGAMAAKAAKGMAASKAAPIAEAAVGNTGPAARYQRKQTRIDIKNAKWGSNQGISDAQREAALASTQRAQYVQQAGFQAEAARGGVDPRTALLLASQGQQAQAAALGQQAAAMEQASSQVAAQQREALGGRIDAAAERRRKMAATVFQETAAEKAGIAKAYGTGEIDYELLGSWGHG